MFDQLLASIRGSFNPKANAVTTEALNEDLWFETFKGGERSLSVHIQNEAQREFLASTLKALGIEYNIRNSSAVGGDEMLSVTGAENIQKLRAAKPDIEQNLEQNGKAVLEEIKARGQRRVEAFNLEAAAKKQKDKEIAFTLGAFRWFVENNTLKAPLQTPEHRKILADTLNKLAITEYSITDFKQPNAYSVLSLPLGIGNKIFELNPYVQEIAETNTRKRQQQALEQASDAQAALKGLPMKEDLTGGIVLETPAGDVKNIEYIKRALGKSSIEFEVKPGAEGGHDIHIKKMDSIVKLMRVLGDVSLQPASRDSRPSLHRLPGSETVRVAGNETLVAPRLM